MRFAKSFLPLVCVGEVFKKQKDQFQRKTLCWNNPELWNGYSNLLSLQYYYHHKHFSFSLFSWRPRKEFSEFEYLFNAIACRSILAGEN